MRNNRVTGTELDMILADPGLPAETREKLEKLKREVTEFYRKEQVRYWALKRAAHVREIRRRIRKAERRVTDAYASGDLRTAKRESATIGTLTEELTKLEAEDGGAAAPAGHIAVHASDGPGIPPERAEDQV